MKSTRPFLASIFLALSALSPSAFAVCDTCVTSAIATATTTLTTAIGTVVTSINTGFNVTLVNALRGATQTLSAQQAKSAELVAEANQRTHAAMETERQNARYAVPDACAVVAATKGLQDATRGAPALGGGVGRGAGGGTRSASGGVTGEMQKALDISAGRAPAPAPEHQAALAASGACGSFVSSRGNPVRANTCSLAGFSPNAGNGHPDADIRAETLFDGPQRADMASSFSRKLTVDPDGAERQALEAYLRNLSTPVDLPQLSKADLARSQGRQYMAYKDSFEARMSLAEKPSRILAQNRTANPALLPVLKQLLASDVTGAFAKDYLDKAYPRWSTRGVSVDEMMNLEAERRYLNKNWHVQMASLPPEAHVKEQTTMMAFQVLLLQRISERLDTLAVVSGQGVATQVRQEMVPQLITLHGQASH
ncbi:hypothetical protein [Ramlibacter sp. AN1133]|uniref:hypothetical protein n=1 Tax=Ramlibacter sp. AN1133 TaxID=3133429 RepID=UPI0030C37246